MPETHLDDGIFADEQRFLELREIVARRGQVERRRAEAVTRTGMSPAQAAWLVIKCIGRFPVKWEDRAELRAELRQAVLDVLALTEIPPEVPHYPLERVWRTLDGRIEADKALTLSPDTDMVLLASERVRQAASLPRSGFSRSDGVAGVLVVRYAEALADRNVSLLFEGTGALMRAKARRALVHQLCLDVRADPVTLLEAISAHYNRHCNDITDLPESRERLRVLAEGLDSSYGFPLSKARVNSDAENAAKAYTTFKERDDHMKRLVMARFEWGERLPYIERLAKRGLPVLLARELVAKARLSESGRLTAAQMDSHVRGWEASQDMPAELVAALFGVDKRLIDQYLKLSVDDPFISRARV